MGWCGGRAKGERVCSVSVRGAWGEGWRSGVAQLRALGGGGGGDSGWVRGHPSLTCCVSEGEGSGVVGVSE